MVKAEWGTKRTCPKCATRFYDLGKDDPVTCIECSSTWTPEPILKSKQPLPFEAAKPDLVKFISQRRNMPVVLKQGPRRKGLETFSQEARKIFSKDGV